MPQFDASTPTTTRKFSDITFTVPNIFAAEHPLTANEAAFLNTMVGSVVGNAYSGDIRRAMAAHNVEAKKAFIAEGGKAKDWKDITDTSVLGWDHAAKFASKFADYELGASNRGDGTGAKSSDPISRMVAQLNSEDIKARLAAKGFKVSPLYKAPATDPKYSSKWAELLAQNLATKGESFRTQAEAILGNISANDADDDLLAGLEEVEAETPAAA